MWLRLIGPPGLFADSGQPYPLATKKQIALLVYLNLAVGRHGVRREEITELLWPSLTLARGRQSLSQGLSEIRNILGKDALTRGGSYVALLRKLPTDIVDIANLRVDDGASATALEGLEDVSGTAFAHWVEAARVTITGKLLQRLNEDIDRLRTSGDHTVVRERAKQLYGIDPTNVRAISILAEDAAAHGDVNFAVTLVERALDQHNQHGQFESLALRSLYERLTTHVRPKPCDDFANPPLSLVGRQDELHRLHTATSRPKQNAAALITGTPGVGKTAIAHRFVAELEADGALCIRVTCTNPVDPFYAVQRCVQVLTESPELGTTDPQSLAELCRIAPFLRSRYPGIPDVPLDRPESLTPGPLATALASAIGAVVTTNNAAIWLDDVDRIDPASLAIVRVLLSVTLPFPLTLVATTSCDYETRYAPCDQIDTMPWTDILSVKPLSAALSHRLIEIQTGSRDNLPATSCLANLVRWCGGLPLLVQLALSDLITNRQRPFVLHYQPHQIGYRWEVPPDIRAQMERRYRGFWSQADAIVDFLSLSVLPLTIDALCHLTHMPEETVLRALKLGLDLGILVVAKEGFVFPVGMLRAYGAARMSHHRWLHCHLTLARHHLEQSKGDAAPLLEAIPHLRIAGDGIAAAKASRDAALRFLRNGNPRMAERLLRNSLQVPNEACDSTFLVLARVIAARGRLGEAMRVLKRVDPGKLSDAEEQTRYLLTREVANNLVPVTKNRRHVETKGDKPTRVPRRGSLDGRTLLLACETAAHERDWKELRRIARTAQRARAQDMGLLSLAFCQMAMGFYTQALRNFQRSGGLFTHQKKRLEQARAFNGLGTCAFAIGRFSTAVAAFKNAYESSLCVGNESFAAAIASNLAAIYTDYDFPRKAADWLGRSRPALEKRHGRNRYRFAVLANHADHLVTHGKVTGTTGSVGCEFDAPNDKVAPDINLVCARADVFLSRGQWDMAMREVGLASGLLRHQIGVKTIRLMPGFDSPHMARLLYLKAWYSGSRGETRRMYAGWPTSSMTVAQQVELTGVFGWCAEQEDHDDKAGTASRAYQRAATLVEQHGLSGTLRRLDALGVLGRVLQPLIA